jgi:L-ascorbate metabolism protein UlaG (beta-lactamase superfamily)
MKLRTLLQRTGLALALILFLLLAWVLVQANRRPPIEPYAALVLPAASAGTPITVRFAGVATLVFDDGETAFMTDGFFTRPGWTRMLFTRIATDEQAVDAGLAQLGVRRLAAVVTNHAHYDHAMDSSLVARKTGAVLIGDASTMNIGKGAGLPAQAMRQVSAGESVQLGQWRLTFVPSAHAPTPWSHTGQNVDPIGEILVQPARANAWHVGQPWSLLVEHGDGDQRRSYLVQGSAGFIEGALRGRHADVVLLGVGAAGKQPTEYRRQFWNEMVRTVGAKRVIAIHWDDFWVGLDQPLRAMPYLTDDLEATMTDLRQFAAEGGVDLRLPPLFARFDPGP